MLLSLLLAASTMRPLDFYIGTYTAPDGSKGVYRSTLDPETGDLSEPVLAATTPNPSFVAVRPDGKSLYAVQETEEGKVNAFRIEKDGTLKGWGLAGGLGNAPCYVSVDPTGKCLLVANYGDGRVAAIGLQKDGSLGAIRTFTNAGGGPNAERQKGPHAHCIAAEPQGRFAYACDLGTDEILAFRFNAADASLATPLRTKAKPGAGPRHLAFDPDRPYLYVNNELDNTVGAFRIEAETGALTPLQTVSSLPVGERGTSHSANIAVHPTGRWVYVSNRGRDTMAVFRTLDDGKLETVEIEPLGVREPRGFAVDPTGNWLVVAGQNSDELITLPIDPDSGRLGRAVGRIHVPKPTCVAF